MPVPPSTLWDEFFFSVVFGLFLNTKRSAQENIPSAFEYCHRLVTLDLRSEKKQKSLELGSVPIPLIAAAAYGSRTPVSAGRWITPPAFIVAEIRDLYTPEVSLIQKPQGQRPPPESPVPWAPGFSPGVVDFALLLKAG